MNVTPSILAGPFLKLCRCFRQGLKMCIMFGYNPQIISLQFELSHVLALLLPKHQNTGYLVNATPPTILSRCFKTLHVCP